MILMFRFVNICNTGGVFWDSQLCIIRKMGKDESERLERT
jgi:hypothetical protein